VSRHGWLCPACGSGVAPHVERCPCKATAAEPVAPDDKLAEAIRRASQERPVVVPMPTPRPIWIDPYVPRWDEFTITCGVDFASGTDRAGVILS
jgi:hypothetical protein